ncbi:hypothetical protein AJ80_05501 [Polytolypa hystricis UAMH7299]|uniref:Alpha/beta hydrolase fold-3 domain-containing protein n=1 Tax=Polytolypa hystricis (strain UAMH7299) TaxID=1447883 RepID=A0A2B7XUP0_POLH7|nr:hypothetical protein AJ80_05501 [Polytolypa hystricis UAMH7299]
MKEAKSPPSCKAEHFGLVSDRMSQAECQPPGSPRLSPFGWINLASKIIYIVFTLIGKAIFAIFHRPAGTASWAWHVKLEGMRSFQSGLTMVEIQHVRRSTNSRCKKFAREQRLQTSTVHVPDGFTGHWFGSPDASRVVVYFHGGGYTAPLNCEQLLVMQECIKGLEDVSGFVLSYALASEQANPYPLQLQQAVAMIDYLINDVKKKPENIILASDSAGAHLTLGVLLHISHPHPKIPPINNLQGLLRGALLISPWVTFDVSAPSMHSNEGKDTLRRSSLAYWAKNFLDGAEVDAWNTPLSAPSEWWADLKVEDILVTYGEDELMRDDITTFCATLQAHHSRITTKMFPEEFHGYAIISHFLGRKSACESERFYVQWVRDILEPSNTQKLN